MDIYQPAGDVSAPRALVVMAHGGSFITGSKTGPDVVGFCQDLAKMGYVVASINYRLGFGIANLQAEATAAVMRG
jgi:carboxylesterase type B